MEVVRRFVYLLEDATPVKERPMPIIDAIPPLPDRPWGTRELVIEDDPGRALDAGERPAGARSAGA